MEYVIRHGDHIGNAGTLTIEAGSDADAVIQVRRLITDGARNNVWAAIDLTNGRTYQCANEHGVPVGRVISGAVLS